MTLPGTYALRAVATVHWALRKDRDLKDIKDTAYSPYVDIVLQKSQCPCGASEIYFGYNT